MKQWVGLLIAACACGVLIGSCFKTPKLDPCPGKLTCPNGVCCPSGYPFNCNGKCYTTASVCTASYVTCSGSSPSSSGCAAGQSLCDSVCVDSTLVCCHHGNGAVCPAGDTCGTSSAAPCFKPSSGNPGSGTASGGSAGSGASSGSSSGTSSGSGVPCTQGTHPAWMQGECVSVTACNCKLSVCVRMANGGCCEGYDLGNVFIPCNGSGGSSCGDCTSAAMAAYQQCGCPQH